MRRESIWLQLYVFVGMTHIISLVTALEWLSILTKCLLMPLLFMYVYTCIEHKHPVFKPVAGALLFSWVGDVLLLFQESNSLFFILGLAAFLLAHLTYILVFRRAVRTGESTLRAFWMLLPLLFAGALLVRIYAGLEDMAIPVFAYALAISAMCIFAMRRAGRTDAYSFGFVLAGAVIFILSDSMIAWNSFYRPFALARLLIMSTYIFAQYLIITGIMLHYKTNRD